MATNVYYSRVLTCGVARVWELLRPLDFVYRTSVIQPALGAGARAPADQGVGSERVITYKDGAVQRLRVVALSDLKYSISWDVFAATPALSVSAVSHTVQLTRITEENSTLIEWTTEFSSDVTTEVLEDARFKQQDQVEDLLAAIVFKFKRVVAVESKEGKAEEKPSEAKTAAPTVSERIARAQAESQVLFDAIDVNKDGFISRAEFLSKMKTDAAFKAILVKNGLKPIFIFEQLDGNGDDQISVDEFTRVFIEEEKKQATVVAIRSPLRALFDRIDTNGDGSVSRAELSAALKTDASFTALLAKNGIKATYVFEQFDADASGEVSFREFCQALI